jgi:hypothetical protein
MSRLHQRLLTVRELASEASLVGSIDLVLNHAIDRAEMRHNDEHSESNNCHTPHSR